MTVWEKVCDAPDAVGRLRRFVLDLAVRGKLVEQRDSPARQKSLFVAGQRTPAFAYPDGWRAVTIGDVLDQLLTGPFGSSLHQSDYVLGGTPVINPASIQSERIVPVPRMSVGQDTLARLASFRVCVGDVVMARRGEMGRCAIVSAREVGWLCGTGSLILRPSGKIDGHFLVKLISSPYGREFLGGSAVGTTMQNLNQGILLRMPFGLPPLAEQHRIVAKIDELMALCDRLETARAEREATRDRLAAASLARLNTPDPETFPEDARFTLDTLPALTTRPDQIKQLRQTILNLAIRGALVPQRPGEQPSLDDRVRFRSAVHLQNPVFVAQDETPYDLPPGWVWITLGCLTIHSDSGWSPKTEDHPRRLPAWGVLKVSAVSWGVFKPDENKQVLSGTDPRMQAAVRRGDFLISRANTAELVAKAVLVTEQPEKLMMSDKIVRLKLSNRCDPQYILLVNNYGMFARSYYARLASGVSASMRNVSRDVIMNLPIPLPPLAEQHRIVTKVTGLMFLCDRLEASLVAGAETRRALLEATLRDALAPALDQAA